MYVCILFMYVMYVMYVCRCLCMYAILYVNTCSFLLIFSCV